MVEKAAEDYDVLARTIYHKRVRQWVQPIISDELSMIIMRFSKDVKSLGIRFIRNDKPLVVSFVSMFYD